MMFSRLVSKPICEALANKWNYGPRRRSPTQCLQSTGELLLLLQHLRCEIADLLGPSRVPLGAHI